MSASSRRTGTVIIGAGLMGRWHAHAVHAIGRNVIAVADDDIDRAKRLAERYGASATTDLGEAFSKGPIAAHVCTPPSSHINVATTAIGHGVNVLIEKPFAPSLDDTATILRLAADAGLIACPVHQFLFQRGMRNAVKRMGDFGPLRHVDFVACSAGADGAPELRGQLALDILPHPLSVLRRLLGHSLDSAKWQATSPAAGEVRIAGECQGISVGIVISACGRPTRNTARLIGERGTMHLDLFHGFGTFERPNVSRAAKAARPFEVSAGLFARAAGNLAIRVLAREPAYPGLRSLIDSFYRSVEAGGKSPIQSDEVLDVARAADRLTGLLAGESGL